MINGTIRRLIAVTAAGACTAAAAAPIVPPVSSSWWEVVVLGIPLGVLAASLAGSSARSLRDASQPDATLLQRAIGTLVDGFIGGWSAMFLIGFSLTRGYFDGIAPAILGAFGGLLTEFLRANGPRWAEQLWQTALQWITRKRAGDTPQ